MSTFLRTLSCSALIVLLCAVPAMGQDTGSIAGQVTEEGTGESLPGVNVVVQGTSRGAATGPQGAYSITDVPEGTYTLRATFVGFQPETVENVEVEAGETTNVDLSMQVQERGLEELVVVAYGQQERQNITGAMGSVEADDIESTTTSFQEALQGTVAGVEVTQGDAAPGGGFSIQIRGITSTTSDNQPLYVVDGVPLNSGVAGNEVLGANSGAGSTLQQGTDTNPLASLSPSNIESIQVLKDASATALYGSRASNGVVLIETKDGGGQESNVSVNYARRFSTPVRTLDMLDAGEYAGYVNEAQINAGFGPVYGSGDERAGDPRTPQGIRDSVETIDWQDRIFQTAAVDDLGLSYTGGDEAGSYIVRGSLLRQEGIIIGSQFLRGGLRTNLNQDINDIVTVQANLNVTRSTNSMVRTSSGNNGDTGGIVRGAQKHTPLRPFIRNPEQLEDPRAVFEQNRFPDRFGANPVRYTDEVTLEQNVTRGIGNLKTLVDLTDYLTLDLSVGANYNDKRFRTYYPSTVGEGEQFNGVASLGKSDFLQLSTENLLRYDLAFGNHSVSGLLGGSYETNESEWNKSESQDFPDDQIGRFSLAAGNISLAAQNDFQEWRLLSGLSRLQYSYADRYNLTLSFRADGSSKFAVNEKWGYFPSVGASWQVSNEPFLDGANWLSNAKLRGSWGLTGTQAIGPYGSKAQLTLGSVTFANEVTASASSPAFGGLPNDDLKWESTSQSNLGIDLAFFDSRFRITSDIYQKVTDDLLQQIQLGPNTGFQRALINAGTVRNRGIELQVGADILTGDVRWTVSANASRNVNEITDLAVEEQFAQRLGSGRINFSPFIQREGLPIGALYGYETDGIYRSAEQIRSDSSVALPENGGGTLVGDIRVEDIATTCTSQLVSQGVCSEGQQRVMGRPDGQIDPNDRTVIGDTNPDVVLGLTNSFEIGNFSARFIIDSKIGGDIVNAQRIRTLRLDGQGNIPKEIYENAFRPEEIYGEAANPDGKYPMPRSDRGTFSRFMDVFVEDGSYVRLKSLQLGYTVGDDLIPYASQARLYVRGSNLFTITDYSGYSPEVSAFNQAQRQGVDLGSYPQNRTFGVGIDLTF